MLAYESLLKKNYKITFKDGTQITFFFAPENFYHIMGLHKLTDLHLLQKRPNNTARTIYKRIKGREITYEYLQKSSFLWKIQTRIDAFPTEIHSLFSPRSKFVVSFDPRLISETDISGDYVLYKSYNDGYLHLFIVNHYPETFIYEDSKKYLSAQQLLEVQSVDIVPFHPKKKKLYKK